MRFRRLLEKWKQLSRKKKIISIISIILVLALAGGALGYQLWFKKPRQIVTIDENGEVVVTQEEAPLSLDRRINLLLIGIDERKNSRDKTYRTDTLILASIDPISKQVSMLSIPRDTRVQIPKRGMDKINAAAAYGGLNMTVAVVQDLTGVKIDGYVKTNFDGFKGIIDTLGGVMINVEKDMYYETGDEVDGVINLKKGEQLLDGSKALQYARFRHDAFADITRTARQQIVLKAVAQKLMQPGTITKIPTLIPQFTSMVETNLPPSDLLTLAKVAVGYDSSKVISQTLPGYFLDDDGISYWGVNPTEVKKVVADLFNGIVIGNTPDKLVTASVEASKSGSKPVTQEPEPEIVLGGITAKVLSATSISIDVSASRGVAKAEVWRTTPNGQFLVGNSWSGTSGVHLVDNSLQPSTAYYYVLKVYDAKGNMLMAKNSNQVTTSEQQTPVIVKPSLSIDEPQTDNVTTNTQTIKVSGSADSGCKVYINNDLVAADGGKFSQQVSLSPGANTITVKAVNVAGETVKTKIVTYTPPAPSKPSLTVTSPHNNDQVTTETVEVTGTVDPGCSVTVNGQQAIVTGGTFKCQINLNEGSNTLEIKAKSSTGTPSDTIILTIIRNKVG